MVGQDWTGPETWLGFGRQLRLRGVNDTCHSVTGTDPIFKKSFLNKNEHFLNFLILHIAI